MALLLVVLLAFLLSAWAQNSTEVRVELGQNVTLNCSLDIPDIYWYMEIHSSVKVCIIRTFSGVPILQVSAPAHKYNSKQGNRLQISNVTAEDYRLYSCASKLQGSIRYKDTFHLRPVTLKPPPSPLTDEQTSQQHTCRLCQDELVVYSSFTLNALLLLLLLGVVLPCLCLRRKTCSKRGGDPSPLTCEDPETLEMPQYEEIQLPPHRAPPAALPHDGIYYKAQLPQDTLPPHRHLQSC
uniref:uncharacterized protein n=1 Tax=Semicossyphus pulcher TaxID=241346 RepID=UPI0037E7ECD5